MAKANSTACVDGAATLSPAAMREELFKALSAGTEGFLKLGSLLSVIGRALPDDEADLIAIAKIGEDLAGNYYDSFDRQKTTYDAAFQSESEHAS